MQQFFNLWVWWSVLAGICFIAEVFIPGFWAAAVGIGALTASISAFLFKDLTIQLIVFATATILSFFYLRPFAMKYLFQKGDKAHTNADAMIGMQVKVIESIDTINNKGRVKIGSEEWRARTENNAQIAVDTVVEITRVDSATVYVKEIG